MAESTAPGPSRELLPARRFEWERVVRRVKMPLGVKAVAFVLASYGSANGTRIRPGRQRLANVCYSTPRSITRALVELRDMGLIERVSEGSNFGRQARADEYRLTLPSDLLDAVKMLGPDEGTGDTDDTGNLPERVTAASPDRGGTGDISSMEQVTSGTDQVTSETGSGDTSVSLPEQDQPSTPEHDHSRVETVVTTGAVDNAWPVDAGSSPEKCGCNGGFVGWDEDHRPIPCTNCRPHLARVIPLRERNAG